MIRFLPTIRIGYFSPQMALVLELASRWSLEHRTDVEVNSGRDGTHGADSLHPWDLALDLDTIGDQTDDTRSLAAYLRVWLPPGYDVVFEWDHVHVEWDMRRPPLVAR